MAWVMTNVRKGRGGRGRAGAARAAIACALALGLMGQAAPQGDDGRPPAHSTLPRPSLGDAGAEPFPGETRERPPEPSELQDPAESPVGIYSAPDGSQRFILDRTERDAKLQFEGSDEVLFLSNEPAQRGDRLLKLDTGEVLLRITTWGGLTLFTPDNKGGIPVEREGDAGPLVVADPPIAALQAGADALAAAAARLTGSPVTVTVDWAALPDDAGVRAVLHDALRNTEAGLAAAAASPEGRAALAARLSRIRFVLGEEPAAGFSEGLFTVVITPPLGLGGRLSSAAIAAIALR